MKKYCFFIARYSFPKPNLMHWILNNIKKLRIEKNYTQEAMALELGISTSWYNKLENGHKKLTLKQIETIAKILNVPLKEILYENNNVFPPPIFLHAQRKTRN